MNFLKLPDLPIMASSIQQPSKESFRVGHGQVFGILTNYALLEKQDHFNTTSLGRALNSAKQNKTIVLKLARDLA